MIDQRRENLIDRHTYVGKLPNGDAISHECDGRHCNLPEQIRQAEARQTKGER